MKDYELSQAGEPDGASLQCQTNPPRRILVVDDDSDLRQLYTDVLVRPGYHVDAEEDGAAGWEALQANNYNLLITEHSIPKLTGVELVRKLRAARMALPVVGNSDKSPARHRRCPRTDRSAAKLAKPAISRWFTAVMILLRSSVFS
ncbi:MAG: response regulator [Verrucomicrobiota bacterium]